MASLLRRTTAPTALQRRSHQVAVAVTHMTSRGHLQRCLSGAPEPAEPGPEQQEGVQDSSTSASSLRKYFKPQSEKPSSSTSGQGFGEPKKPLANSMDPRLQNRLILSNDLTEDQWRAIDAKVNKYPGPRVFTAIGSGGDDFKASVVEAVSAVVGQIHSECVSTRPSAQGTYVSVKLEVIVRSPDQVLEVYQAIRKEPRLKWCM